MTLTGATPPDSERDPWPDSAVHLPASTDQGRRVLPRGGRWWGLGFGLVAALPQLSGTLALARAGWSPTLDEAVIAWRSWDVLHGNAPLLGQFTQASAHATTAIFDPGPLLYWWLALPTTLDPDIGPVVGVALLAAVVMALACIAVGQVAGRRGALLVAAGFLLLQWSLAAQLGGIPVWNPYAALLPFAAAVVLAWVVASGLLRWWPVLVALASLCAQTHLMYAAALLLLVLAAPLVGARNGVRTGPRPRPLVSGLVVGLVCWAAPLIDLLPGHRDNLGNLWRATAGGSEPTLGATYALRTLGHALLVPVWSHPPSPKQLPPASSGSEWMVVAVVILLALAIGAVAALRRTTTGAPRNAALGGACLVALVADLGGGAALAGVTWIRVETLAYIKYVMWPAAAATWMAAALGVAWLISSRRAAPLPLTRSYRRAVRLPGISAISGLATILTLGVGLSIAGAVAAPDWAQHAERRSQIQSAARSTVALVTASGVKQGRISVDVEFLSGFDSLSYLLTTGYELRTKGFTPAVSPVWCPALEKVYCRLADDPRLIVQSTAVPRAHRLGSVLIPAGARGTTRAGAWLLPRGSKR